METENFKNLLLENLNDLIKLAEEKKINLVIGIDIGGQDTIDLSDNYILKTNNITSTDLCIISNYWSSNIIDSFDKDINIS